MTTLELPQITGADLLTNSRLSCLKACPKRHYWAYELGLRPDRDGQPLRMGGAFHAGLEAYANTGDLDAATMIVRDNYADVPDWALEEPVYSEWLAECEKVVRLLCGHAWRWAQDNMTVIATELRFELPIRNPATGSTTPIFKMAGKIDKIVRLEDGRLAVLEYKTTSDDILPDSDYWKRLRIDQQISLYMVAARQLGHDVQTVLYDVTRKPSISPKKLSQPDTAAFLDTRTYCGEKFELAMDGERYTVNGQTVKLDGSGKKPTIRETPAMYGARLNADIAERPDFYFGRMEIPRLNSDLEEFEGELWDLQQQLRESQRHGRHVRNTAACLSPFRCSFFELCTTGYQHVGSVPPGFIAVGDLHQELLQES